MNIAVHTYIRRALVVTGVFAILCLGTAVHAQDTGKIQLSKRMQDRITNLTSNVVDRSTAAANRLSQIEGRIASRIDKLEAEGVDTALAIERFDQGRETLIDAKNGIANLSTAAEAMASDQPKEAFEALRTEFLDIRLNLIKTQQAFTDTVNLLKETSSTETE